MKRLGILRPYESYIAVKKVNLKTKPNLYAIYLIRCTQSVTINGKLEVITDVT